MERRNLSSSYPELFNGCLIVKRRLSTQYMVCGMFTGHGGHGNALPFLQGFAWLLISFYRQFSPELLLSNLSVEERI